MAKYRKKPIEIEAYQITRELLESCLFDGKPYPVGLYLTSCSYNEEGKEINSWFGEIETIHKQRVAVVENDWIITEPNGINHYPCKPEIFEATYEKI